MYTIDDILNEILDSNDFLNGYEILPVAVSFQIRWIVNGENFGLLETFTSYEEAVHEIYKRKAKKYIQDIINNASKDAGVNENVFKEALLEILTQ